MASAIAIAIHTVAIILLGTAGFRLSHFAEPLAEYSRLETPVYVQQLSDRLLPVAAYLAATSAANRSRRGEAFVLRALGLRPAHRRTLRAGETVAVAGYAVIAGGAVGVIVAALVLPLFLAVGA